MMESLDLSKPRTGNLQLCECGHLKTFHFRRARWHGGPMTDHEPCAHCAGGPNTDTGCQAFKAGAFQGYKFEQGKHA